MSRQMLAGTKPEPVLSSADPIFRQPKRRKAGLLFIAPFSVLFLFVFIIPICYSAYTSLFQNKLIGGKVFVGLDNYLKLFQDSQFYDGALRVVLFTAIQVPIMLFSAIALALAVDSLKLHGTRFFRIVVFLPYAIPAIVSTLMWGFMLGIKYGLLGSLNQATGASFNPFAPETTMISIGVMVTWGFTGYNMLIFYAALRAVPRELYEAAAIDGASELQIIRHIKLPALRSSLIVTIIFSIIGTFQLFNEPNILATLVSNSGITSYYTPNMYAYSLAFNGSQQGYAAALALVMAAFTIGIAYAVQIKGMKNVLNK
ncbi:carbohydrate ABC transporter permease [Paenarthrobacter sp. NPDC089675]|uniref:carbohydrate ABC transporter permease n=1 Tax=Paenarthrobacter sp. NPDC089675 TaxID=3364376 RepID=UPI0037FE1B09